MGIKRKIEPLIRCFSEKPRLCPPISAIRNLHPGTWGACPPKMDIIIIQETEKLHLLKFGGLHEFWFPRSMLPSKELWSEYLVISWNHPSNAHFYLRHSVKLETEDVVLDCGACEGFFTRQALDLGVKKVICVEPNLEMAECLEKTFESEISEGRVIVKNVALGSISGNASFDCSPGEAFSGHFSETGTLVPITTLGRLAQEIGSPTMIKMDLEGSEYEALRGGVDYLASNQPKLAITTYHYIWDYSVISSYLKGCSYKNIRCSASTFRETSTPRPVMLYAW